MADKLEWMNKHFVLLRHKTVQEAVEKEKYKLRPDLAQFVTAEPMSAEEFVYNLQENGKYKEACDFLSYIMHRRAAVWWGYNCLLTLAEELEINPATERDIADIGAPKEMPVPEWAKEPTPEEQQQRWADAEKRLQEAVAKMQDAQNRLQETITNIHKLFKPEDVAVWDKAYGAVDEEFKRIHGIGMMELIKTAAEKTEGPLFEIDENSPIFMAADKLKEDIESKRKETIDLIKSVIPPKMPEHQKKLCDSAMNAVYRWIVAPDEGNSQAALDIGNECPDQPAGLLAMAAFWSFGNLMPEGKQVVQTPAGLAANGINSALLQAALQQGGTRKYKERCKLYLELGLQVIRCENVWEESLTEKTPPHENIKQTLDPAAESTPRRETPNVYKKWTPNQK